MNRRVRRVVLRWEAAASASYDVQISDSASGPWTNLYTTSAGDGGVDDLGGLAASGRYGRPSRTSRSAASSRSATTTSRASR